MPVSGNPLDAADLVQETFVRALPKFDRQPPERAGTLERWAEAPSRT